MTGRLRDDLVATNVPIGPMTTYKLGGPAAWFAEPGSLNDLRQVIEAFPEEEKIVLGRGSNVVISDAGFPGLVIRLAGAFSDVTIDGDIVEAGGAAALPVLARTAVKAGRGGLEWCVGVPGSVGGAVRMNAGCHGSDVADSLEGVEVVSLDDGRADYRAAADLDLSYRHSNLTDDEIVVRARFRTEPTEVDAGMEEVRRITQWRREHQPGGTFNAGSVFKNPPGDAAGRLIDAVGLKGHRLGSVRVSPRHANFFEADEGATAQELRDLVFEVRKVVAEATGTWLDPEVRFIGDFSQSPAEVTP